MPRRHDSSLSNLEAKVNTLEGTSNQLIQNRTMPEPSLGLANTPRLADAVGLTRAEYVRKAVDIGLRVRYNDLINLITGIG